MPQFPNCASNASANLKCRQIKFNLTKIFRQLQFDMRGVPLKLTKGSFCPPKNFVVKRVERYTTSLVRHVLQLAIAEPKSCFSVTSRKKSKHSCANCSFTAISSSISCSSTLSNFCWLDDSTYHETKIFFPEVVTTNNFQYKSCLRCKSCKTISNFWFYFVFVCLQFQKTHARSCKNSHSFSVYQNKQK